MWIIIVFFTITPVQYVQFVWNVYKKPRSIHFYLNSSTLLDFYSFSKVTHKSLCYLSIRNLLFLKKEI